MNFTLLGDLDTSLEHPVWFPLPDHLPAICIKGVINDPLGRIQVMVVLEAHMSKAFSNRFKARAFGLIPERIVSVSSILD